MNAAYSTDRPIHSSQADQFRRSMYAVRLAQTIASRSDASSLVISLNAPWGEGKTSILKMLEEELSRNPHIIVVWFNPWNFGTQEQLLTGYFHVLAAALKKNLKRGKEVAGEVISILGKVAGAVTGFVGLSADGVTQAGDALSSISLEELKDRLSSLLREEQKRVVVFMDDIDRLDKSEIQAVFKMVKLTADFDYLTYVLAFDDVVVSAALQERYGSSDQEAGRRFLEKIVQVPLQLPLLQQDALYEYTIRALNRVLADVSMQLSPEEDQTFVYAFHEGLLPRITTPRVANLYANTVHFAVPLMLGEVNTVDFMLIEGMRVLYPQLYRFVRDNPDIFLLQQHSSFVNVQKLHEQQKEAIEAALFGLEPAEKKAAMKLLEHLFPCIKSIYSNYAFNWESDAQWGRAKKVGSHAYFKRFFAYGVPGSDVSDLLVLSWLDQASTDPPEVVAQQLLEVVTENNANTVIKKLRQGETTVELQPALVLARAVALIADRLPHSMWPFDSAKSQAAIYVLNLIKRLPTPADQVAELLAQIAPPLPLDFQLEILRYSKITLWENNPALQAAQPDLLNQLSEALVVQVETLDENLLETQPDGVLHLLRLWADRRSRADTQAYLLALFDRAPGQLFKWMARYLPVPMDPRGTQRPEVESENYRSMAVVLDPAELAVRLERQFPDWRSRVNNWGGWTQEEGLAVTFLQQHEAATAAPPQTE